jgi:trimethylamine--corrinoid protein Co-methyltransferase
MMPEPATPESAKPASAGAAPARPITRSQRAIRFAKLAPEQCERLHQSVLQLLGEQGVEIRHERARELLKAAGATVDGERVRFPADLVDWAIAAAPRSIALHDHAGNLVMPAGEDRVFFGPGSETQYVIDHRTGERRHGTLRDVTDGARVIDALPNFDFDMSLFLPWDADPTAAYLLQYREMLAHCDKPHVLITPSSDDVRSMVAMLDAAVGGAQERIARPRDMIYVNVTHPFCHEYDEVEKALFLAEQGMPFMYATATLGGLLAPVLPPAGKLVGIAGDLVGVVLAQVAREGAPVAIAGGLTHVVDMRTMLATYAAPEDRVLGADMLRYYGLPFFGMGGASDSKAVDAQAAAEAAMTLMTEALGGANILHDVGYLESGSSNCLTHLVICDEIISWVRGLMRPVEIDEVTVPMDLIREYGIDGDYVASDHTLDHFRELWQPGLFDRGLRTHWEAAGGRTLAEVAAERVDAILAAEPAPKLDAATLASLDEIIAEHAVRAGG